MSIKKTKEEKLCYYFEKLQSQKNDFIDSCMFKLCYDFLNEIVDAPKHTPSYKLSLCRESIKLFEKFKSNNANSLSWSTLCQISKGSDVNLSKFNIFVIYLLEKSHLRSCLGEGLILEYLKLHHHWVCFEKIYSTDISNIFAFYFYNDKIDIVVINANQFVKELLKEFILESPQVRSVASAKVFYELFENSFEDINFAKSISSLEDFSCEIFKQQFFFFDKMDNKFLLSILINFYLFLSGKCMKLFKITDELDIYILQRANFITEYTRGARKVLFNPFQGVPEYDIWYLDINSLNYSTNKYSDEFRKVVDFTIIKNDYYRKLAKEYFWNAPDTITIKLQRFHHIKPFFNYISDIKSGKELSIYVKPRINIDFTTIAINEIMAFKTFVDNKEQSDVSFNAFILSAKYILKYLSQSNFLYLEQGVLYYLKSKQYQENNNAHPIPNDELIKLADLMIIKAKNSYEDKLNNAIFYIALETEFRISHILSLEINCVEEASKPNEYIIKSIDKTSDGNLVEHPITIYTKKHIDDIIKISQEVRDDCKNPHLKKYLFLSKTIRKNIYSKHNELQFNSFLKNCCKELELPKYTASNLRDTHITKAQEYIIRNNKSNMEQSALTGHKNLFSDNYYIKTKIIDMLETVYMTTIGDVDIKGQIADCISPDIANEENLVSNKCGYCSRDYCNEYSYLDCLMCQSFIATVDRTAYFQEQINVIDNKIKNANVKHDKEDLVNIKQLLLNYVKMLLIRKEELNK